MLYAEARSEVLQCGKGLIRQLADLECWDKHRQEQRVQEMASAACASCVQEQTASGAIHASAPPSCAGRSLMAPQRPARWARGLGLSQPREGPSLRWWRNARCPAGAGGGGRRPIHRVLRFLRNCFVNVTKLQILRH